MPSHQNPNVEEVSTDNGLTVGFKGGRPPDEVVVVDGMTALERSGSPVPGEVQPLQKRGRNLEEAMIIDDESGKVTPENLGLVGGVSQVQVAADRMSEPLIPSFKDKLVGSKGALDPVVARSFKLRCSLVLDLNFVERGSVWDRGWRLFLECKAINAAAVRGPAVELNTETRWISPPRGKIKCNVDASGSMQGFRFATPPAAVAFAVEADKCLGKDDSVTAVVDINGSVTAVVD
ncbi:hypothetical protein V6N13_133759 [Hibiscus sabdariffa]